MAFFPLDPSQPEPLTSSVLSVVQSVVGWCACAFPHERFPFFLGSCSSYTAAGLPPFPSPVYHSILLPSAWVLAIEPVDPGLSPLQFFPCLVQTSMRSNAPNSLVVFHTTAHRVREKRRLISWESRASSRPAPPSMELQRHRQYNQVHILARATPRLGRS